MPSAPPHLLKIGTPASERPGRALRSDEQVKIVAELPGLAVRDVEVTLAAGELTLKGQKKVENDGALYSERWEGQLARDIDVGDDIDPDKVDASFKDGVLTVVLAKKPEAERQVKRIAIH